MKAGPIAPRVCVIGERLNDPPDEGRKKFVYSLSRSMAEIASVHCISAGNSQRTMDGFKPVAANRLLASSALARELRAFAPDIVCYVPYSSGTIFSFLRCAVLRNAAPSARIAMLLLQRRDHGLISRWLIRLLKPDVVLVQDEASRRHFERMGCRTWVLASGADLEEFAPAPPEEKAALRRSWGVKEEDFLVLHVGHVKRGRNVAHLARLNGDCRTLLVGSTSTQQDARLAEDLRRSGVTLHDGYMPDIGSAYRAADCYVFPVESDEDSIGVPLSVLEAMACNLRVVSTRFAGLPLLFEEGDGLLFLDSLDKLPAKVAEAREIQKVRTREKVAPYSWSRVAREVISSVRFAG